MLNVPVEFPLDYVRKQLTAMEKTLQEYKDGMHDCDYCTLCSNAHEYLQDVYGKMAECKNKCVFCPWFWFTGDDCDSFYAEKFPNGGAGVLEQKYINTKPKILQMYQGRMIKNRKRQLKDWIRRLRVWIKNEVEHGLGNIIEGPRTDLASDGILCETWWTRMTADEAIRFTEKYIGKTWMRMVPEKSTGYVRLSVSDVKFFNDWFGYGECVGK